MLDRGNNLRLIKISNKASTTCDCEAEIKEIILELT